MDRLLCSISDQGEMGVLGSVGNTCWDGKCWERVCFEDSADARMDGSGRCWIHQRNRKDDCGNPKTQQHRQARPEHGLQIRIFSQIQVHHVLSLLCCNILRSCFRCQMYNR